jgi:hypothetical protein
LSVIDASTISSERAALLARVNELDDAIREAASTLDASRASNKTFREYILRGEPLPEALAAIKTSVTLNSVAEKLKNLETARHRSRTAVFRVGMAEGHSIGQIGRLYGFSRQLAQRFAKEARQGG